jgi:hypothetical protein
MSPAKKKAKAKSAVKFKDLESKKSPKGGPIYMHKQSISFLKDG